MPPPPAAHSAASLPASSMTLRPEGKKIEARVQYKRHPNKSDPRSRADTRRNQRQHRTQTGAEQRGAWDNKSITTHCRASSSSGENEAASSNPNQKLHPKRAATVNPRREENCSAPGGGGVTQKPSFPTPAPPSLAAVTGGGVQGRGARPAVPGGGGGQPNIYGSK